MAEEARVTAEVMKPRRATAMSGLRVSIDCSEEIGCSMRVVIVAAGMDGVCRAWWEVWSCPVIAVPTSRGYDASFGGVAALLTMLNSCAAGVGVMNIDNGFGAACLAHRINMLGVEK